MIFLPRSSVLGSVRFLCTSLLLTSCFSGVGFAQQEISLGEALAKVAESNLRVRAERLTLDAARAEARGERGLFEPEFVATFSRESNDRQNTRERFLSQSATSFSEDNVRGSVALETLLPLGTQLRVGAQTARLDNSLQTTGNREFESFTGVNITQPLLKNAGVKANLAQLRIAASQSEVVLHDTRRQLTTILSQTELTYWDLARAVAELELREASLGVAESIRDDNKARLDAGRMSELEVRRAEAGVALRRAQVLEARQRVVDLSSLMRIYFGEREVADAVGLKPRDPITVAPVKINFSASRAAALTSHPGYLARRAQFVQAGLRTDYARNQRLPQLDLRASYGYNGLDTDFRGSWDTVAGTDFPSWFVGAELRVPILTGVKSANQLRAARHREDAASAELVATEIELLNLLQAIIRRLASQDGQIAAFVSAAEVAQQVLDAELEGLESGRSDSRRVLDAEQDVFEANAALLGARTDYRRSLVEFRSLEGTYLSALGYDLLEDSSEKKSFFRLTL